MDYLEIKTTDYSVIAVVVIICKRCSNKKGYDNMYENI